MPSFLARHRRAPNVGLHLLATTLALLSGVSCLYAVAPTLTLVIVGLYTLSLAIFLPWRVWGLTAGVLMSSVAAAVVWPLGPLTSLAVLAVAFTLQAVAQLLERVNLRRLRGDNDRAGWLPACERGYFQLPLSLVAVFHCDGSIFSFLIPRNRMFFLQLHRQGFGESLDCLRDFALAHGCGTAKSAHFWQLKLSGDERQAFDALAEADPILAALANHFGERYTIALRPDMNELYVAPAASDFSSDNVFYASHVDGPIPVYPLVSVYRCLLAVNENSHVHTHFPMCGSDYNQPLSYTLTSGHAATFDYHREPHYITSDPQPPTKRRISLKMHYLIYPKWLGPYARVLGDLTSWYNSSSRGIFLQTINPDGLLARFKTWALLASTIGFQFMVRMIGWGNLCYVTLCALLSAALWDMRPLLLGAGFVQYMLYIGVLADRKNVSLMKFRRDVTFYTLVSMGLLLACYGSFVTYDFRSLAMIAAGFGLAAWAATSPARRVITARPEEWTRTTFLSPWILLGTLLGLAGIHLLEPFRAAFGWLVPLHIALCLAVLLQYVLTRGSPSGENSVVAELQA